MSPKKSDEEDVTLEEAKAADAGLPQEESLADAIGAHETTKANAPKGKYQEGTWHGVPNFKCPHCNFATPVRDIAKGDALIAQHVEGRHPESWLEGV